MGETRYLQGPDILMRRRSLLFLLLTLLRPMGLDGQSVTFHEHVAPIIYGNCTECHREGEVGPMPFTTYAEVAAYGEFIELSLIHI